MRKYTLFHLIALMSWLSFFALIWLLILGVPVKIPVVWASIFLALGVFFGMGGPDGQ